jgi:dUTP pyrophosphatase
MQIRVKRLNDDAVLPSYAHGPLEDAGMDLRSTERVVLAPGAPQGVPTGIAIELPSGFEAQVRPRSGMALKHAITCNFGTIDPGYRGEIRVIMFNLGKTDYVVEKGDRIAQLVVAPYTGVEWDEGELGDSTRGAGGFGSSGR